MSTNLHEDVSCHSEAGVVRLAEPLHERPGHTDAVLVQQESEDRTVPREELQSPDTVEQSLPRGGRVFAGQYSQQRV